MGSSWSRSRGYRRRGDTGKGDAQRYILDPIRYDGNLLKK